MPFRRGRCSSLARVDSADVSNSSAPDASSHARSLAAAHERAMLPCPICAASVRGTNLASHLERHAPSTSSSTNSGGLTVWRGADRASRPALIALLLALWLVSIAGFVFLAPIDDVEASSLIAIGLVGFVPLTLSLLDRLPARIESDGKRLRLVWAAGLLSREVSSSAPFEVGRLLERRSPPGVSQYSPAEDVAVGQYLRIGTGAHHITVGASKGTGFRKHWAERDWRAGPARRRWDVQLDAPAMVALEYHLASLGLLSPRGE